jgi:hypothetical protein
MINRADTITQVSVRGKILELPSLQIDGRNVVSRGKWIKVASVKDEQYVEGEVVPNPELFIARLKEWEPKPDLFTFTQKITDPNPRFRYRMEWDNFAAIPITTYDSWLQTRIKPDVRKSLRRSKKEGVLVEVSEYNDQFVHGIKGIYDESPMRQGMRFWHYAKPFDAVKKENGTYRERSEFIGAYFEGELIGFLKLIFTGNLARSVQVLSKEKYHHKRPTNALIAKAVEICADRGMAFLVYGRYDYPGKTESSLTQFKARNGFERVNFPRYYVPLTVKGRLVMALRFNNGIKPLLPSAIVKTALEIRSSFYKQAKLS